MPLKTGTLFVLYIMGAFPSPISSHEDFLKIYWHLVLVKVAKCGVLGSIRGMASL